MAIATAADTLKHCSRLEFISFPCNSWTRSIRAYTVTCAEVDEMRCDVNGRCAPGIRGQRTPGFGRSETKLKGLNPGLRTPMYPYVALRCPTYRENSHANHTWNPQLHQTTYFKSSEAMPVWVRFPSPAPLLVAWHVLALP
jgi:hypothetical protein